MNRRTLFITGGNRGIGRAIVEHFAKNNYDILVCNRNPNEEFDSFCEALNTVSGAEIQKFYADLSDEQSVKNCVSLILKSKPKIDVMINNAGVVEKGLLQMTPIQRIRDVFQINFFAQVQFIQGISKLMMRQRSGVIINMASIGGIDAFPAYVSYGCSKAAIVYLTKTLAQEFAPYNIRVNALAPSMVNTKMKDQMGKEANEEVLRRTALKRNADPDEIAKLAFFLASDDSTFITGQVIRIDGGM